MMKQHSVHSIRLGRESRCARLRAGYTLIELTAVVFLISVALYVIFVNLDYMTPQYRLGAGAREIGTLLRLGRAHAISHGVTCAVVYNISDGKFSLRAQVPPPPELTGNEPESSTDKPGGNPEDQRQMIDTKDLSGEWELIDERELPPGVWIRDIEKGNSQPYTDGEVTVTMDTFGRITGHVVHLVQANPADKGDTAGVTSLVVNELTGFVEYIDEDRHIETPTVEADK